MRFQSRELEERWFACLSLRRFFLSFFYFSFFCFFSFFFIIMRYLFYVHKVLCSASYQEKKTYEPNVFPPASPCHGKNQTPRIHRKSPPHLAPKTKPPTRRETIHRDVQERDPNPSAGPQVTLRKESKKRLATTTIANMPNPRTGMVKSG